MINDVIREVEVKMKKSVEALRHHLATVRTGRASPALVESLMVDAYGSMMPLNQLAGISVPEPRMLVIQPYDASTIKAIEKAIQNSELGINPTDDGRLIRLALPALTEQRRKDLAKVVRTRLEESRVAVRNNRREGLDDLKDLLAEKMISEDDHRRGQEKLQQMTDNYIKELEQIGATKEAEISEV